MAARGSTRLLVVVLALLVASVRAAPLEDDISLDELLSAGQKAALPIQVSQPWVTETICMPTPCLLKSVISKLLSIRSRCPKFDATVERQF